MNRQKDLFDLFRENQHKLDEAPSAHTWRRLERRLDNHHRRRRPRLAGSRMLSMAAALLLLAVITFLFSLIVEKRNPAYLALNQNRPLPMEDLTYTDVDRGAYQVVEFTRQYQDRLAKPIEEGSPNKRLVPASAVRTGWTAEQRSTRTPAASPALLTDFYWLLGQWTSDLNGRASREFWTLQAPDQIRGEGLLIAGADTIFRERMELRQIDNRLFFLMALDKSMQPVRYELVSRDGHRAVFENNSIDFPQQVVLTFDEAGAYTLRLQNRQPAQMTRSQVDYIGHRHTLHNQQAVRTMSREEE